MASKFPCKVTGWERKLLKGESILPDPKKLPFWSQSAADAGLELFESLKVTALPGVPRQGDVCVPWVRDFVHYWMGAQHPVTGERSVQEGLVLVSKKNTKSSSMGLLLLAQFLATQRRHAHAIIVAPTQDAADTAFRLVAGAIDADKDLKKMYRVLKNRTIQDNRPGWYTELSVKSADINVLTGTIAQYILLDECHILLEQNGAEFMMEHVRGAREGLPEASMLMTTTHAHEIPTGVWKSELDAYRLIHEGKLDSPKLFARYEWPEKFIEQKKHLDPKYFYVTNPSMGYTIKQERMEANLLYEKAKGPLAESGWRQQFTNLAPEHNAAPNAWMGARYWMDAVDDDPDLGDPSHKGLDALLKRSEAICIGIDGGGLYDLLSVYVIGREAQRGRWLGWGHSWAHEKIEKTHPSVWKHVRAFAERGEISVVDYQVMEDGRRGINLTELGQMLSYIHANGRFLPGASVGIDKGGMPLLVDSLMDPTLPFPIPKHQIAKITQGRDLAPTIEAMAQRVLQGTFLHGNQGIMQWACSNVILRPSGNSFVCEKQDLAPGKKIDPFIAMICAARCLEMSPETITPFTVMQVGTRKRRDRRKYKKVARSYQADVA